MVTYETEFKEEAVKMANQLGAAKAAKNLGIPVNTLYTWISRAKSQGQFHSTTKSQRYVSTGETADLMKRIKELEKANRILSFTGCSAFFRSEPKVVTKREVFKFIHAKRRQYGLCVLCKVLLVSRQGYHKWLKAKDRPYKHGMLLALIRKLRSEDEENRDNYGVFLMFPALRNHYGYSGGYSTVCRICRANGITLKKKRNPNGLTKADKHTHKSENLIRQDFSATKPNEKWLRDITEIPCADGKLYVVPVFDCFDGSIIGLAMDDNMRKELCIKAFEQACRRPKATDMILHTDRGSQVRQEVA